MFSTSSHFQLALRTSARARLGVIALFVTLLVGCGEQSGDQSVASGDGRSAYGLADASGETFWRRLALVANEREGYPTLDQAVAAADVVLVGRVDNVALARSVQGDAAEDTLTFGDFRMSVTRHISGKPESVDVEFLLLPQAFGVDPESLIDAESLIDTVNGQLPSNDVLILLREQRSSGGGYQLINSTGLWIETAEGLEAPLWSPSEDDVSLPYADETTSLRTLAALADRVASP